MAVMIPVLMKVKTARKDLLERREMPQMPWPLVQPDAKDVPNPTRNPVIPRPVRDNLGMRIMCHGSHRTRLSSSSEK